MMLRRYVFAVLLVFTCLAGGPAMTAAPPADPDVETSVRRDRFNRSSTAIARAAMGEKAAAQFDLRQYSIGESVVRDFARWNRVREKLAARQMPPPQAKQPDERAAPR
jgi:hypothetical protein